MLTIVMSYFNRQEQLSKTLQTLKGKDFNVVIVDDCSPEEIILPDVDFDIEVVRIEEKKYTSQAHVFNLGFQVALEYDPEIIILQNAECMHVGEVIEYARKATDELYISFGCYSLPKTWDGVINNRGASHNGESAWYNHPAYRPCGYHFCSAITTNLLKKLNGFDESYCYGIAYEDDEFLRRVKEVADVQITSSPYVLHQYHENMQIGSSLIEHNRELFTKPYQNRAYHFITPVL